MAQRRLAEATSSLAANYEHLSSGLRINRASDDAAGLAVASVLSSKSRVYTQSLRNINDGVSALNIAQGATSGMTDILQRLRELAVQSANGVFSLTQRLSMDKEAYALTNEYNRIIGSTSFNGRMVIDGSLSEFRIQAGCGAEESVSFGLGQSLSRNTGTGSFSAGFSYAYGANVSGMAQGDLNGDGKLDVVTSLADQSVRIQFGNGDGTFAAPITLQVQTGSNPGSAVIADFNSDGRLDMAVQSQDTFDFSTAYLNIYINQGQGQFSSQPTQTISFNSSGGTMRSGDLNGDGVIDLAVADLGENNLLFFRNKGNGSMDSPAVIASLGISPADFEIRDINSDGTQDIVACGGIGGPSHGWVTALRNNGNGTFQQVQSYDLGVGIAVWGVELGDFNHDGWIDMVASTRSQSNAYTVQVYQGLGNGTFSNSTSYAAHIPSSLAAVDINGDGNLDLIGRGSVHFGKGDGTFDAMVTISPTLGVMPSYGDINNDGVLDVINAGTSSLQCSLGNTSNSNNIQRLNLETRADALASLAIIDAATARVSSETGAIGATLSRLETTLAALGARRDNYLEAASRITDADVASESAELMRRQILQQAAGAVLGQANQAPQIALLLLRSV